MKDASQEIERYVDTAIVPSINCLLGRSHALLWETYAMAFKYANSTSVCIEFRSQTTHVWLTSQQTKDEEDLIIDTLRLWVDSRMLSTKADICGDESIGMLVRDKTSPYYDTIPAAPVLCAQLEVIITSTLQPRLETRILQKLRKMMYGRRGQGNWFATYLTTFIILHSCSMTSSRDAEWVRLTRNDVS
jgi:hypothetical protein